MILYTKPYTKQQTLFLQNKIDIAKSVAKIIFFATVLLSCLSFFSCTKENKKRVVIWTDNPAFASYTELFNATYDVQAVVVYKEEIYRSLPPAKDELIPDLIIASWLKSSSTQKYFSPLDRLFGSQKINRQNFYEKLLSYGKIKDTYYLLPVSFNLPAMVFNKRNSEFINDEHLLTLSSLQTSATEFNKKSKNQTYTAMGFAPSWDAEFIYQISKLGGANYTETEDSFSWNDEALEHTLNQLKDWTLQSNTDTQTEQNFKFKYLYMPNYQQISSENCLFSYMSSKEFFELNSETIENSSFRWLANNGKVMIKDDILMLGIYRHGKNPQLADFFIEWLFAEETQKILLERTKKMKLDSNLFGIAGGLSSLKNVNEQIFPAYYRELLGNLPLEEYLTIPNILPNKWQSIKSHVIYPYLLDKTNTSEQNTQTLEQRLDTWKRQLF